MTRKEKTLGLMRVAHAQLDAANKALKAAQDTKTASIHNSMTSLVQGFSGGPFPDNITSFNPLYNSNIYAPITLNWMLLQYAWKTHGLIQNLIEVPVLDAYRGGLEFDTGEIEPEEIEELKEAVNERSYMRDFVRARSWARLFGGAALVVITEQDPKTPLDLRRLKGKKLALYAANRWELMAPYRIPNKFEGPIYGPQDIVPANRDPENQSYVFYGEEFHPSRVLTMVGKEAPWTIRWQLNGWGLSEIERIIEPLNAFIRAVNVIYELLEVAKLDVYQIEGLKATLATTIGTQQMRDRLTLMNMLKSYQNAVVLDKNDEYSQHQVTFSGLAEMLREVRINFAAAARMPLNKLFGIGATGFASGEDDIENYNAMVESEIREPGKPELKRMLDIVSWNLFGSEFNLRPRYHPLRVLSAEQEETVKSSKQARWQAAVTAGLMTGKEYADMCYKEGLVPMEITPREAGHAAPPEMGPGAEPGEQDKGE